MSISQESKVLEVSKVFCLFGMFIRRLHESSRDKNKLHTSGGFKRDVLVAHSSPGRPTELIPGYFSQCLGFQQRPRSPGGGGASQKQVVNRCVLLPFGRIDFDIFCSTLPSVPELVTVADFLLNPPPPPPRECLCNKPTSLLLLL